MGGTGYYGASSSGLGISLDDLLSHVRKLEKREQQHELQMAPLITEAIALQATAAQAQQQTVLQAQVLETQAAQTGQLLDYVPYILGGLGVLGAAILVIRARRRKR